jgi:hypothetical protein
MDQSRLPGPWLLGLCYEALGWIRRNSKPKTVSAPNIPTTSAYAQLVFAFGLARLGEAGASRSLTEQAEGVLLGKDEIHEVLCRAYRYRIDEALAGRPRAGPLPEGVLVQIERLDKMPRFVVDRLRQHSRILEPDQKIDPYRGPWETSNDLQRSLAPLYVLPDSEELASRVETLLREVSPGHNASESRKWWILMAALNLAPRVGEEFARRILEATTLAYDGLPETDRQNRVWLLARGLFVAAHFGWWDYLQNLAARCKRLLASQPGPGAALAMELLTGPYLRGLQKLGRRDEIDSLLEWVVQRAQETQRVSDLESLLELVTKDGSHLRDPFWLAALRALVQAASGWLYLGRDNRAEPVLEAGRTLLFRARLKPQDQTDLACAYARTLGQAPVGMTQQRLEELFEKLDGVRDSFTTNSHYGLLQIEVIEAAVLAVIDGPCGPPVARYAR